jgi:hypothetical protein
MKIKVATHEHDTGTDLNDTLFIQDSDDAHLAFLPLINSYQSVYVDASRLQRIRTSIFQILFARKKKMPRFDIHHSSSSWIESLREIGFVGMFPLKDD